MKTLNLKAPAKINLHLQVIKKRPDNYHEIRTVFQLINLYDHLIISASKKEIKLNQQNLEIEDNIIMRAALKLKKHTNTSTGADISLLKRIPLKKGLGGGSSDAACTLIGLNHLWKTGLCPDDLCSIGADLGADIPIFIQGTSCWGEGKGEILSQINLPKKLFLLAFPKVGISTKLAFEAIKINSKKEITLLDFKKGKKINDFQDWAINSSSEIYEAFDILTKYGNPMLTGTGSALFIEFINLEEGKMALNKIQRKLEAILVNSLDYSPLRPLLS